MTVGHCSSGLLHCSTESTKPLLWERPSARSQPSNLAKGFNPARSWVNRLDNK